MLAAYLVEIISLEEAYQAGINQAAASQVRVFNLTVLVLVVNFDYLEVLVLVS